MANNPASIGDALIFMTEGIGVVLAALVLLGGFWWWDKWSYVATLETERELSREAVNQADLLNRQISALRVQKASLEQALDLEQQKVEDQQVTIPDLGHKRSLAISGKVAELESARGGCADQ